MLKNITGFVLLIFYLNASSQLPVRNEPMHHNVFENDHVRILNVFIAPGDTTLYHLHNTPSVFIIFTNTRSGSQLLGKAPQTGINLPGVINYDSITTPRIHRVWNDDTSWFHVMDVELTAAKNRTDMSVLDDPLLKLLFNKKQVNGYGTELTKGNSLQLPASENGYLLVSMDNATIDYKINDAVQHRLMQAGHYIWIDAGKKSSLKSVGQLPVSLFLLQLK